MTWGRPGARLVAIVAAAVAGLLAVSAASAVEGQATPPEVAIFYYPWWSTPAHDGNWVHWNLQGARPPGSVAADFYPARGPYSSADVRIVRAHMREIAALGVDTVVSSWWGFGSPEDARLPLVKREAERVGLGVAIHVEPFPGRTATTAAGAISSLAARGYRDFYVYDSTTISDAQWKPALAILEGVRVFANTALVGRAVQGGFDGFYTYDVFIYDGTQFRRTCKAAHARGLLCAPSVGPGYKATRATGDTRVQGREGGRRYDSLWRQATRAQPDLITITSYNEWHEGTQIEPARARPGYDSYEGAWGRTGQAAERAYLDRTRFWIGRL
ncbi:MAG: alpha-mannosidase [Gaiella sp.]